MHLITMTSLFWWSNVLGLKMIEVSKQLSQRGATKILKPLFKTGSEPIYLPIYNFWVMLLTSRQADRQTNQHYPKHNFLLPRRKLSHLIKSLNLSPLWCFLASVDSDYPQAWCNLFCLIQKCRYFATSYECVVQCISWLPYVKQHWETLGT